MTATQLEQLFESRGYRRGGMLLLSPDVALELVSRARAAGIRVLGIDGFRVSADAIEPLMDQIADWSADPHGWQDSVAFLQARLLSGLLFEVTLDG